MKAAGADTVITGNWGTDLSLLVRAAKDAGLNTLFYTFTGGPGHSAGDRRGRGRVACYGSE